MKMENLNSYVKKRYLELPNYTGYCTFEEFCYLNDFDENTISEGAINYYYKWVYSKFAARSHEGKMIAIEESLKSHNSEWVIKRLNKNFPNYYSRDIKTYETEQEENIQHKKDLHIKVGIVVMSVPKDNPLVDRTSLSTCLLKSTKESDKLYEILDFELYNLTYIWFDIKRQEYDLYFEPVYTDSAVNIVKAGGNIVYHVTSKENYNKIKRTGLRPRVGLAPYHGPEYYRVFPERIFLICNSETVKKDIQHAITDLELRKNDYVILKIDVSKRNIGFFVDDASTNKNHIYTLEAIPPSLITPIWDIDDI